VPAREPAGLGNDGALVLLVGDDLGQLRLNVVGLSGLATDPAEGEGGILETALLHEVSGRVGQEGQTNAQNQGPGELNTDGDPVRPRVRPVLGGVDHARGEQDTDSDAELVARHQGTTDFPGALLERC
jgi:hypothetical protein